MAAYVSKYSWRSGYNYKVSAETVGGVLKEIEESEGEVTSKSFLEYSRPEDSVTHSMFEWDDTVAAEKFRLYQSGRIINQLAIEIVYTDDGKPTEMSVDMVEQSAPEQKKQIVSAYVNTVGKSTRASACFTNVIDALNDSAKRSVVLENAKSELSSFKKKYGSLKELAVVVKAIDIVLESE